MPEIGPLGRGGARRRTRRRMTAMSEASSESEQYSGVKPENLDKLEELAKLLKDKGVITEEEFNSLFD